MREIFGSLATLDFEQLEFVLLDADGRVLIHRRYTDRMSDQVFPPFREIVGQALSKDAKSIVVAHNHPTSAPDPSPQDIQFTRRLVGILHPLGIQVLDHLIVARAGYFSFRDAGLL